LLVIAADSETGKNIGYCICSVFNDYGEIDSIFVEEQYRKHNVGNEFMIKANQFFRDHSVKNKFLSVYVGNEQAILFYNRHHYYQKHIILEKKD